MSTMMRSSVLCSVFLSGLVGVAAAQEEGDLPRNTADLWRRDGREFLERVPELGRNPTGVLVRFAPGASEAYRRGVRELVGDGSHRAYDLVPGLELVRVRVPVETALARLAPWVEYAEVDRVVRRTATPNDTYYGLQYGLNNTGQTVNGDTGTAGADINAPEAWDVTTGDPNFAIAILDSGVQYSHPDLSANIWANPGEIAGNGIDDDGNGYVDDVRGWDFYSNDNNPDDADGHGTHTAGTVGAVGNNGAGVTGVNWRCKLVPLRFLGPNGGYISDAIEAVQYCTTKGIKVSNNSWGGGGYSQSMYDAIAASRNVGHVFVAAAGNAGTNNDSSPFYPASYGVDNVISVAATDNDDRRASFSNYGATTVDLGAPGVMIASTYRGSGYVYMDGTSMASPHVAGVVALVYGQNPTWTYSQVRNRILSTVRPVAALATNTATGGVVDAAAAVGAGTGNTAPSVTISSPANNTSVVSGTSVTFSGSASDVQDGNLTASLVWSSNLQGQIGTGGSFSRSDLVVGTHTITASATDSGSLTGTASVTLIVQSSGTAPAAPGTPTLTNLGGGSVRVQWADNSNNESGFTIERQRRVGSSWTNTTLFQVGSNTTVYNDSGLSTGRYRYRVRAWNSFGNSAWSSYRNINL
jgi:hypothetical protein